MQVKTCSATIKAAGPTESVEEGVVEAVVATYDVDSIGDRIIPGAFAESLQAYKDAGRPLPFVWSHKSDDPEYHIGVVEEAEERPGVGLWVKARIDMDEPKARKAYKLMKGRRVTQFSFSYDELDARPAPKDDSGAKKDLHQLKLYEVGPTLIGCNQATSLLDVKQDPSMAISSPTQGNPAETTKSLDERITEALDAFDAELKSANAEAKAGPPGFTPKPIVARIRKLVAAAQALLDAVEPGSNTDDSKATPAQPADPPAAEKAAEPVEPARPGTASSRLRTDLDLLWAEADSYSI